MYNKRVTDYNKRFRQYKRNNKMLLRLNKLRVNKIKNRFLFKSKLKSYKVKFRILRENLKKVKLIIKNSNRNNKIN